MNFKKYGIGISTEKNFKIKNGINPNIKTCLLLEKFNNLFRRKHIGFLTDRKLFDNMQNNIEFYKSIKSYRGLRHRNNYPVRGQRTHTNAHKKAIKIPNFR